MKKLPENSGTIKRKDMINIIIERLRNNEPVEDIIIAGLMTGYSRKKIDEYIGEAENILKYIKYVKEGSKE